MSCAVLAACGAGGSAQAAAAGDGRSVRPAFRTGAYSTLSDWPGGGVIGIHGTNQPQLIPGAPSHGCIRVPNAAISRLWPLLPVGTPVLIL